MLAMISSGKTVWELLWDYDPNGLVVVNEQLQIQLVNPAFCEMFRCNQPDLIGRDVGSVLDDPEDFAQVWETDQTIRKRQRYDKYDLFVKKVIFPIRDQGIIACIMVDITSDWKQRQELLRLKEETLRNVDAVVDKQMKVAQEIAGLLGETTAATKVNMLKLTAMLKKEEL